MCEEVYESNGDIGPSLDAVLDGEEIEYYIEEVINKKRGRDDVTRSSAGPSIETKGKSNALEQENLG